MYTSNLALCRLMALLFAMVMVSAAPTATTDDKYSYKVAKRDDIVRRGTRTHVLMRRASALPGQLTYAVFDNVQQFGSSNGIPEEISDVTAPTFDACAQLCNAQTACEYFRWGKVGPANECALRGGTPGVAASEDFRSANKGVTCAEAKARYPDLEPFTCVEEFH